TSLRMWDERNTACPADLASATVSRKTASISGSRPLVGSSSTSRSGRAANALAGVELETVDQRAAVGLVDAAAQAGQELEALEARERRPQHRLTGHERHPPVGPHGVAPGVDPEDRGAALARPLQAQDEPDRGRLARPVRPQIAVHLARRDGE